MKTGDCGRSLPHSEPSSAAANRSFVKDEAKKLTPPGRLAVKQTAKN